MIIGCVIFIQSNTHPEGHKRLIQPIQRAEAQTPTAAKLAAAHAAAHKLSY
jgi:hypothetical protein